MSGGEGEGEGEGEGPDHLTKLDELYLGRDLELLPFPDRLTVLVDDRSDQTLLADVHLQCTQCMHMDT